MLVHLRKINHSLTILALYFLPSTANVLVMYLFIAITDLFCLETHRMKTFMIHCSVRFSIRWLVTNIIVLLFYENKHTTLNVTLLFNVYIFWIFYIANLYDTVKLVCGTVPYLRRVLNTCSKWTCAINTVLLFFAERYECITVSVTQSTCLVPPHIWNSLGLFQNMYCFLLKIV